MYYHPVFKMILFLFFLFMAVSCGKEGYVTYNTALYSDEKLSQKQNILVHRGDYLKIKKCSKESCLVSYLDQYEGYLSVKHLLDKKTTKIVTFVKDAELKKEPDLMGETIKKVESHTRGFLIAEQKRWSLVDIDTSRGWVLMEKLYPGESPFKLFITIAKLTLEFSGKWYIPFVSAERFFSIEKAFDQNPISFAIVRKNENVSITLKSPDPDQRKFVLKYEPPKELKYKNLSLPEEITFEAPFSQAIKVKDGLSIDFEGNFISFRVTGAAKELIYLNDFSIAVKNEQ